MGPYSMSQEAASAVRPDTPRAIAFFLQVQEMVKGNDRNGLSKMVAYPMLTTLHGKKVQIYNRTNLLKHFDEIFDKGVRCAILQAKESDVGGMDRGFTIWNGPVPGSIWFDDRLPRGYVFKPGSTDYWNAAPFKIVTVNNAMPVNMCIVVP
jgi:hypothetical protein